jgi:preprotein translocase subunit SecF
VQGLNFGIDFTGGTILEIAFSDTADLPAIRSRLADSGYEDAVVQNFGTARDVLVRMAPREGVSQEELSNKVFSVIKAETTGGVELRRVEFVGPQVGEELTEEGGLAMLIALAAILVYVGLRFEYRLALGAVAALAHDVIITLGVFSVLSLEFDLTVLAALLAVIGYSLNDTIVVFDRVRENFRKIRKGDPIQVINTSLNQTLSRTLMTSGTTMLVLVALFVLGGELIHGFATALIVGIVVGTYSSIYVASTIALALGISKADLMPVVKEGAEADSRP